MAYAVLEKSLSLKLACEGLISGIISGAITKKGLEYEKIRIARKYSIGRVIKNAEILNYIEKDDPNFHFVNNILKIKPVRTLSGVANISVMWLDKSRKIIPTLEFYLKQHGWPRKLDIILIKPQRRRQSFGLLRNKLS